MLSTALRLPAIEETKDMTLFVFQFNNPDMTTRFDNVVSLKIEGDNITMIKKDGERITVLGVSRVESN